MVKKKPVKKRIVSKKTVKRKPMKKVVRKPVKRKTVKKKKGKKGKKIQTKTLSSTGTDQDEENSLSTEKAVEDGLDLLILKMKQFMFKGIVRVS